MRYALDALGWYDFESLAQALLKLRLGIGVEAWGGSGDWGRDAYFRGRLRYPTNDEADGPFIFQAKFVDAANAAGARPEPALIHAVKKECERIVNRLARRGTPEAEPPKHYALLTNASIGGSTRSTIETSLRAVLPGAGIHVHDGGDVCSWLDLSPAIARSFPQILGTNSLEILLSTWTSVDVINRSNAALSEAREVARVFVPTEAYRRALSVIEQHNFVILEGPPEMGKTSIGRSIGLVAVSSGFEILEIRHPEELHRSYRKDACQLFVSDDFFGRTEYDPQLTSKWEAELRHVLRLLDSNHRLVLTTRAHLLNLAKQDLDIGPAGRRFPALGEVIVDANQLTGVEKAHMLYRHAKAAEVSIEVRRVVKQFAREIVTNAHFTPERIRILVQEKIPELLASQEALGERELAVSIADTLRDPTRGMSITFKKLRPSQKWLLFALIDVESRPWLLPGQRSSLREVYEQMCPIDVRDPFEVVEGALAEAFVSKRARPGEIQWVHPSCRDLAIRELADDARLRAAFLARCSLGGLHVATSVGGGHSGDLAFPLLCTDEDWTVLAARLDALALGEAGYLALRVVQDNWRAHRAKGTDQQLVERLRGVVVDTVWSRVLSRLNSDASWTVEWLQLLAASPCSQPQIAAAHLWAELKAAALASAQDEGIVPWENTSECRAFVDAAEALSTIGGHQIPTMLEDIEDVAWAISTYAEEDSRGSWDTESWGPMDFDSASTGYSAWGEVCESLVSVLDEGKDVAANVTSAQEYFSRRARQFGDDDDRGNDSYRPTVEREVDVDALFSDL